MTLFLKIVGYAAFIPLMWYAGNKIVRWSLWLSGTQKEVASSNDDASQAAASSAVTIRAGRYIGAFERALIVIGIVTSKWDVLAAVIALKTVARYQELDKQLNAEYFLVGSLASILWALLIAGMLWWYDGALGLHLLSATGPEPTTSTNVQYFWWTRP